MILMRAFYWLLSKLQIGLNFKPKADVAQVLMLVVQILKARIGILKEEIKGD